MIKLVILSGKGGTGKTSVTAAFAKLSIRNNKLRPIFADVDVDASNLELLLDPQILEEHEFVGGSVAIVDHEKCDLCENCIRACRFDAIEEIDQKIIINPISCEGCAACVYQCPSGAIHMESQIAGHWYQSLTNQTKLFHAKLKPAHENSGKLVSKVKEKAIEYGVDNQHNLLLIDGPPGIGCSVIAAITGVNFTLIVTEPSLSGIHDMKRVLKIAEQFKIKSFVCINKYDINLKGTDEIIDFCNSNNLNMVGKIPFDINMTKAMVQGKTIVEFDPKAPASLAIEQIWETILEKIG